MNPINASDQFVEERLLLCTTEAQFGLIDPHVVLKFLEQHVNWQALIRLARQNKILPLLNCVLGSLEKEIVPQAISQSLQSSVQIIAQFNLLCLSELAGLAELLRHASISFLPLKGPVLAQQLFGNIALRQFSDLDILVKRNDVGKSAEILMLRGYRLLVPRKNFSSYDLARLVPYLGSYHIVFHHPEKNVTVELHWRLGAMDRQFPIEGSALWDNLASVDIGGTAFPTFASEDLILYLFIHGSKDQWKRLSWLADVAAFMKQYRDIDWEAVRTKAKKIGNLRPVLLGIFLANQKLEIPIPWAFKRDVARERVKLERMANQSLLFRVDKARSGLSEIRYLIGLRQGLSPKGRAVVEYVFVPRATTCNVLRLPPRLFPVYFFLRPVELFSQYILQRSFADLVRRD